MFSILQCQQLNKIYKISSRSLPRQKPAPLAVIPDEYEFVEWETSAPPLGGTHYESTTLLAGMDVCVYRDSREALPWLGRVVEVFPNSKEFDIHWYEVM